MVICAKTPSDSELFIHFRRLNILSYRVLEGWNRLSQCSGEEEGQLLQVSSLGSLNFFPGGVDRGTPTELWCSERPKAGVQGTKNRLCKCHTQSGRGSSLPPGTIRDVLPSGSDWAPVHSCISTREQGEFDMDMTLTLSFFHALAVVYGEKFPW